MTYLLLNIDGRRVWITISIAGRILDLYLSRIGHSYLNFTRIT